MSEPKEVVKVMAAIARAGYSLQTTIAPENSGDPGTSEGGSGEGTDPPPPPPPDNSEGTSAPSSGDSEEAESTPPPPTQ